MMLSGARGSYGTGPARPSGLRGILISLGLFILVLFVVDKVVLSPVPDHAISAATVIDHLGRHDVRRVTSPRER